ncbi:EAL domain-containing protein [Rhodoblastus acidophilus]|uniref:EAL domain-containing protein n=1 Tax=Candidatus Rhodoblastus alkanivorans TaxID=2954117 RepID=A0ABS9Z5I0_9HYPH|nr:EAL domain-containing protein [Candidatus Rhodoblastus alkanivorans]MCI4678393.1 EAL domain-containing protein [Candidatus Rhodoblastus alkanivorans]MCI4682934.1 EAL domain-containing protein [Candidatus Rhodoblastus alkanivorans]MDI4640244.1 EAL domain-containing protein [Rhodoblastus acidophilus]
MLYSILCLNVITIAFVFSSVAPPFLIYVAPSVLLVAGAIRAYSWRSRRNKPVDPDRASAMLQSVHRFAVGFALAYMAWTLALFLYGDTGRQSQLVYTVVITDIICSFTLAHLPRVALALSAITLPAFLLLLAFSGGSDAKVIALNLAMVALFFGYMVAGSARDFERMVEAQLRSVQLADENRLLANRDSLTGLPNRREFFARLESALDAESAGGGLVVGVIDLDGFKPINDLYGHALGDRVLRECAARLELFSGGATTIARLGGDEFALFMRGRSSEDDILQLGAQICAALKAPLKLAEIHAGLSASIGFARYPQDAMDAHRLYERADYALYYGKQHRRGEPILFSPDHESKMLLNARIQQALRSADLEKEISVEFQPLLDVPSERIIAFEALARWTSPELGPVPPDLFIPVAECGETIHLVTRTILRKALAAARDWPEDIGLSFNLSARDLASPVAMTQLAALIERSAFDPGRLEIEVTETALISDFEHAAHAIQRLKALGARISLDDFGAGYSSLAYIHRLPVDRIKIDRSFVQEMHANSAARDIIKSVISLCDNLKLNCATEGVETLEQLDLLRDYGCNVVQGFYFGAPIGQEAVAEMIAANRKADEGQSLRA